jgi:hypothetical protein
MLSARFSTDETLCEAEAGLGRPPVLGAPLRLLHVLPEHPDRALGIAAERAPR